VAVSTVTRRTRRKRRKRKRDEKRRRMSYLASRSRRREDGHLRRALQRARSLMGPDCPLTTLRFLMYGFFMKLQSQPLPLGQLSLVDYA
jgi:hypothetical protein